MGKPDWDKIKAEYNASTLDRKRLELYAKKVADVLKTNNIAFDGYISEDRKEKYFETESYGFLNLKTRQIEKTRTITIRGEGYWELERGIHTKEEKSNNRGNFTFKSEEEQSRWVLTERGGLKEGRMTEIIASYNSYKPESDGWKWWTMSDSNITDLDYKPRTYDSNRREKGLETTIHSCIPWSNGLLTVHAKGVGCSKKLTQLLSKNGLQNKKG